MEKLLAPFDGGFKEVLKTINIQNTLNILLLEKSLIENFFVQIDHVFSSQDREDTDCGD